MADEEDIDYSTMDWEEQENELEAMEVIYPDGEFVYTSKKPYHFKL